MADITANKFLVLGRADLDFYAEPPGTRLEEARAFRAELGGAAANIAAGLTRLGAAAALISAVADDAAGRRAREELLRFGVGTEHVRTVTGPARTALALTESRAAGCQTVSYQAAAADLQLDAAQIENIDWAAFGALIVTGTALAREPSRGIAFLAIAAARAKDLHVILYAGHEPHVWTNALDAAATLTRAAEQCDIVIGGEHEFAVMAGMSGDGRGLARTLAGRESCVSIYGSGVNGHETFAAGGEFTTPAFAAAVLKTRGADEAFVAAFAAGLAAGHDLPAAVKRGCAAASIVTTRVGTASAMPRAIELSDFIAGRG